MVLVWGVCYTPQKGYPCDRIFSRECKNRFLGFLLLISDLMLAIFTQTSSVTKRNIMGRMGKVVDKAYTRVFLKRHFVEKQEHLRCRYSTAELK